MKDISGAFFKYIDLINLKLNTAICTLFGYLVCSIRGVRIGRNVRFLGRTVFKRNPLSVIIIADNCNFRSSSLSNLIGINRKCIISTLSSSAKIEIGEKCGLSGTVIGAFVSIKLGDKVRCGANTLITDGDWHNEDARSGNPAPIDIKNNVWLGEGVKVLKGVTIGENTVIGAGSVVSKSIPDNVIAAGNPCRVVKSL